MPATSVQAHLLGLAEWDGPLAGAQVSLLALDGTVLPLAATTFTTGVFVVGKSDVPTDFRVVVSGGTMNGQPFQGELRAEVRGYHAHQGYIPVTPITTAISAYMAKHPERSLAEAHARVRAAMAIPEAYDLGHDLIGATHIVDPKVLTARIAASGGIERWADEVAAAANTGGTAAAPRPGHGYGLQQATGSVTTELIKELAKGAAFAIGKEVAGQYLGWALSLVGDPVQSEVSEQLRDLNDSIIALSGQLNSVAIGLQASIANSTYQATSSATLANYLKRNDYVASMLLTLLNADPANPAVASAKQELGVFIDANYPDNIAEDWDTTLRGTEAGGLSGAIQLWNQMVNSASPRFFNITMATQIGTWWSYWDLQQAKAIAIKINRLNDLDPSGSKLRVTQLLNTYTTLRGKQLAALRGLPNDTSTAPIDLPELGITAPAVSLDKFPGHNNALIVEKRNEVTGKTLAWRVDVDIDARTNQRIVVPDAVIDQIYLPALAACQSWSEATTNVPASTWHVAGYQELAGLFSRRAADTDLVGAGFSPFIAHEAKIFAGRVPPQVSQLPDTRVWYIDATDGAGYHVFGPPVLIEGVFLLNFESDAKLTY